MAVYTVREDLIHFQRMLVEYHRWLADEAEYPDFLVDEYIGQRHGVTGQPFNYWDHAEKGWNGPTQCPTAAPDIFLGPTIISYVAQEPDGQADIHEIFID